MVIARTQNIGPFKQSNVLMKVMQDNQKYYDWKNIQFEAGVGDRVKFWTNRWCGVSPFQLTFPVVFGIASNKAAFVVFCLEQLGIEEWRSWDIRFIRRPNDWEMGVVDEFLRTLGSNLPVAENRDCMRWKLTKNGDFDIRSFYNKL